MRYLIIITLLICSAACKRKEHISIKNTLTQITTKARVKEPAKKQLVDEKLSSDFPADNSMFPFKILLAGGTYHEDEVEPQSARYKWIGLFKTDTSYYIASTKLNLKRENDAVLDGEGKKTGWGVYPSVKDTTILLISGLNDLSEGPVDSIAFEKHYLLPGEHKDFTYNKVKYTLYATGNNSLASKERDPYGVSNYKLFLKAIINGEVHQQMILSIAQFDDAICTFIFLGDIDRDGKPDIVIDTTNDYNMSRPTLYLSKPATKGDLLKPVGWFISVGC